MNLSVMVVNNKHLAATACVELTVCNNVNKMVQVAEDCNMQQYDKK